MREEKGAKGNKTGGSGGGGGGGGGKRGGICHLNRPPLGENGVIPQIVGQVEVVSQ